MVNCEPFDLRNFNNPFARALSIIDFGGAGRIGDEVRLYKPKYSSRELIGPSDVLRLKPEYDIYSFAVNAC